MTEKRSAPATIAAQALGWIEPVTRAVVPPLHPSTTFARDEDGGYGSGRVYARADSPAYDQAEAVLAELEGGAAAALFASGSAAASALFLALDPGDHVIIPPVMYWSLRTWLLTFATRWGLAVEVVDPADLDAVRAAVRAGKTKLIWVETPANPLWSISDIAALATIAHGAGARLAVDSTVQTPVLTRPLALGADIVMHSATKYLNGHSDVVAGALVTAVDDEFWRRIKLNRVQMGGILGPFEAWLLLRGIRTLYARVPLACRSAQLLAERLSEHPKVLEVLYPGLPGFPGHEIAKRQMSGGFGAMLSFRVRGGEAAAIATAARVKLWTRATSLGGVESFIEHRASIEGPTSPVPPDLLRLSVGLEAVEDLLADLSGALDGAGD
ncbi:MAG: aminotransferase class V-fold PLP-dependent enzyme [Rhodospirillaceae bacterium]